MARKYGQRMSDLIRGSRAILEKEHPLTVRGVFYRLVSNGLVENNQGEYRSVVKALIEARWSYLNKVRNGRTLEGWEIPFEWIVDESRELRVSGGFDGLGDFLFGLHLSYGRNRWTDQKNFVMVGSEKAAMSVILSPVITEWNVPFIAFKGQISETYAYRIAMMLKAIEKPIKVLYLGDYDGAGLEIPRTAEEKIAEIADRDIEWIRVAINEDHFLELRDQFGIPVNPRDSNPFPYKQRVELDAMPTAQVRGLLNKAIRKFINMKAWKAAGEKEQQERVRLATLIQDLRKQIT